WLNFSPGVVAGLGVAIQVFTQPGDKIILQSPVYSPFFTIVENLGRQVVNNRLQPLNGVYQIDFELLESQIDSRTRMLMLCNPHNPVGRVWTRQELEQLAAICEKHDLLIVTDDIHADLVFSPHQYTPIASLSPEIAKRTITFISPSKSFNMAGLFTSVAIIADTKKAKAYTNRLNDLHMGFANVFGIIALEAAYKHGRDWLQQLLDYIWRNILFVGDFLQSNIPEINMMAPEGTYLLWLDCRNLKLSDQELRNFMIKNAGLGLNDGYTFGPGGSGFQRLNVACPRVILEDAMHRLMNAVRYVR
ncbi:MAG: MalY/PatB family protein, partial [Cyclobacteriaceae bacterium]